MNSTYYKIKPIITLLSITTPRSASFASERIKDLNDQDLRSVSFCEMTTFHYLISCVFLSNHFCWATCNARSISCQAIHFAKLTEHPFGVDCVNIDTLKENAGFVNLATISSSISLSLSDVHVIKLQLCQIRMR